jgi:hypothetical protein
MYFLNSLATSKSESALGAVIWIQRRDYFSSDGLPFGCRAQMQIHSISLTRVSCVCIYLLRRAEPSFFPRARFYFNVFIFIYTCTNRMKRLINRLIKIIGAAISNLICHAFNGCREEHIYHRHNLVGVLLS